MISAVGSEANRLLTRKRGPTAAQRKELGQPLEESEVSLSGNGNGRAGEILEQELRFRRDLEVGRAIGPGSDVQLAFLDPKREGRLVEVERNRRA
jgi:hypothetical protein